MSRVVLAMSGGVDSSVAAHLLVEQGHDVIGVFMRHGEASPACEERAVRIEERVSNSHSLLAPRSSPLYHKQGCCTANDAEDARRVADKLGIPFYALNLQAEFGQIIDYFVREYSAGRTPNPCVQCNNWIKFGKLFDYADSVGAEFVATGHYARLERLPDRSAHLLRGVDAAKDQSYVLFGIRREMLPRMLLPVGNYEKPAIRRMAAALGLRVADKKDSQEICFVTRGRYDEFVRRRRGNSDTVGELVTTDGHVIGEHEGIESFTVGQRKGLGVAFGERKFVVEIDAESNRVVIGARDELYRRELTASRCNWLESGSSMDNGDQQRCYAQIRYNAPAQPAMMTRLSERQLSVVFNEPQFAITPGQAVVCYDADDNQRILGGGWIE
ncbi:MAG TPA: tRNA 2-thiouridine(34) synthase MnmA [Lacipirellulaceae bacterium]|nr:tRNA 2-thiouridine(34) synthase MnmA [Lacipirellulaceae bacterium]